MEFLHSENFRRVSKIANSFVMSLRSCFGSLQTDFHEISYSGVILKSFEIIQVT